ncbi:hypothetical protein SAMN06297251_101453 [Fulvimarina manganoxydans]|uniref:Uncharacterized protein n=1 Tax=Fulvimarina manganoxydans TaxID=937218 RepID=A0A1W1YLV9_9HYPH|nr:hypothetical protein [Fulvimarina manganoxydans]SMC37122.1 hypothetical protein SAMN06297251_101453 [Fulvimarina manganoxydans]
MTREEAIQEVHRCAEALSKALNQAAELGQSVDVEVVSHPREGSRTDRRRVVVHLSGSDVGRRPEDLHSANDF